MNSILRQQKFSDLAQTQGGCLTSSDLLTALAKDHHSSLQASLAPYLKSGKLTRVKRGLYLWADAKAHDVMAHINPTATLSFGNVLAEHLLIGTIPSHHFRFTGDGKDQTIQTSSWKTSLHKLSPHLQFGWTADALGRRTAQPEKAVLDCLYYQQKGMSFSFDLETDIDRQGIDRERFLEFADRYPNPRFRSRCRRWLDAI